MATKMTPQVVAVLPFSLRSIYIRNSSTRTDDRFDPLLPGQQLMPLFRNGEVRCDCREHKISDNGKETVFLSCAFTSKFEFAYIQPTEGNQPVTDEDIEKAIAAQIIAEITADYLVNLPSLPDADVINNWASRNVILHTWPYWREFCHSTLSKMNLPVTIIPLVQMFPDDSHTNAAAPAKKAIQRKTKAAAK